MKKTPYTDNYYERITGDSISSAKKIVPIVMNLIHPNSVLDVGCGSGAFLSIFKDNNVGSILGVDGDWVTEKSLLIPMADFKNADLADELDLQKTFDIVMSVEVAEHVAENHAENFVNNLVRHGDVVLFSAAIPSQGGTHHVNEQWQSYWADIFLKKGYLPYDCIRDRVWSDDKVAYYYAQNIILYVKESAVEKYGFKKEDAITDIRSLNIVHPFLYSTKATKAKRFDRITRFIPWRVKSILLKALRKG